jgi:hypothetical protein
MLTLIKYEKLHSQNGVRYEQPGKPGESHLS